MYKETVMATKGGAPALKPLSATPRAKAGGRDLLLYGLIGALVFAAWLISRQRWFSAGSDTGYWLGVAGGVLMLLLFLYPLRKRVRWMSSIGRTQHWFIAHMVLGIGGPWLILVHSTFHARSLNAEVALNSMLVVAASGVIGRFLYVRVHRGLQGQRRTLEELHEALGVEEDAVASKLRFSDEARQLLSRFHAETSAALAGRVSTTSALAVSWRRFAIQHRVMKVVARDLTRYGQQHGWTARDVRDRTERARRWVKGYLAAAVAVAQFSTMDRLFSLWHVLHVPFVYIMVVTAIAHVVAVHMY